MSNMRNRSQRSSSNSGSHMGSSHSGGSHGGGSHSGSRLKSGSSRPSNGRRSNNGGGSANTAGAKSNYDKYIERANEARSSGDRVSAEKFFQYADHYMRIIIEADEKREASGNKEEFSIDADYNAVDVPEDTDKEQESLGGTPSGNGNVPKEFCL